MPPVFLWIRIRSNDKLKSFDTAQKALKAKYPEPYYLGAFVMQGK